MSDQLDQRRHVPSLAKLAVDLLERDATLSVAEAADEVGVGASSVYQAWYAVHPDRPPRGRHITTAMRRAMAEPFATLCDVMLEHVTARPRTAARIFSAVLNDYGSCHERRLWRALQRLVETGAVQRTGQLCHGSTYSKSHEPER